MRTEIPIHDTAGDAARPDRWLRHCLRNLSDRVHAAEDERARHHGWEVTETTGRFGLGARTYHDRRFEDRRRQLSSPTGNQIISWTKANPCCTKAGKRGSQAGE